MQNNIRTDLAVELNEEISRKAGRLKGIIVNQHKDKDTGIEVTSLKVTNKAGERMIGKPMGTYITIEARKINEMNEDYNNNVTEILKNYISELIGELLKNKKVKTLDVVVATHPDSDHIGSLVDIIDNFDVEKIYMPNQTTDSECYINLIDSCNKKNLKVNYLSKDDSFNLDDSTNIYVLSPSYITDNNNSNSIVLNISYKNNNFLFTGDCEESNEMDMINSYNLEDIDFLKVAHHGSYTASSLTFLEETTPDIAVISCGYKNSYGHPHKSTLDNLESVDAKIFRTDQNGSMQFYSDGEKIYSKVKYKEYK